MKKIALSLSLLLFTAPSHTQDLATQVTEVLINVINKNAHTSYIGEAISQKDHALQAAHFASLSRPNDSEFIIAALFHDIAHQIQDIFEFEGDTFGAFNHGPLGAAFLKSLGFSKKVCYLVEHHAKAKRYLARDKTYYEKLSKASKHTLVLQGGIMNEQEAQAFEKDRYFDELIKIRIADDKAKQKDLKVANSSQYQKIIAKHLKKELVTYTTTQKKKIETLIIRLTSSIEQHHDYHP